MKRSFTIYTDSYDQPFKTIGIFDDSESLLLIKWRQRHEGDKSDSLYEIRMDKTSGVATIKRSGEFRSELIFDTSRSTVGHIYTPFGAIDVEIVTEYINMPSVLSQRFEISYVMGPDKIKNIFSLRLE
ncbi:MAG: DUF1934 domain-containing protein [Saccharofermentans sp.]|nr:DUF1934 domain-containing protein [Saccharofermentans sp.]